MRRIMLHFHNFQNSAFNQNHLPQHNTPPLQIQIRSQVSPSQLRQQHSGLLHRSRASMHRTRPTHVFRQHLDDLQTSLYYSKKRQSFTWCSRICNWASMSVSFVLHFFHSSINSTACSTSLKKAISSNWMFDRNGGTYCFSCDQREKSSWIL